MSLSKTHECLLITGSTQEDWSDITEKKTVEWDVMKQSILTKPKEATEIDQRNEISVVASIDMILFQLVINKGMD